MPGLTEGTIGIGSSTSVEGSGVHPVEMLLLAEGLARDVLLVGAPRIEHFERWLLHQVRAHILSGIGVEVLEAGHGVHTSYPYLVCRRDIGTGRVLDLEALDGELLPVALALDEARLSSVRVGGIDRERSGREWSRHI